MNAIFQFDSSILLWIQNNLRSGFLTPIMVCITHLGDKGILWILLSLVLLFMYRTRRLGVVCAASMVLGLIVTNIILKNWVARVRPYEVIEGLECIVRKAHDWSFPSGHATNSLACAWVLFRRTEKKYGVPALVLAILISLSRLYVGIHYPTDVLAGIAIGIASAEASMWAVPKLERRFPKTAKKVYSLGAGKSNAKQRGRMANRAKAQATNGAKAQTGNRAKAQAGNRAKAQTTDASRAAQRGKAR